MCAGECLSQVSVVPLMFRATRCARGRLPSCLCCLWPHGCSRRRRPRPPARLGVLTSFVAAPRSPPVPSGPSGALHTGGAWCADVWLGASARCPARPHHYPRAPRPCPATAHGHRSQARHPRLGHASAKKFALLASISVHARKSSPSAGKTAQNQRFFACRANFFAVRSRIHS